MPVVGDAVFANPQTLGQMIPVLIVDARYRLDIHELVRVHDFQAPGDVRSTWATNIDDPDQVVLILEFDRPSKTAINIVFSIEKQGILVDGILFSEAFYLQPGKPGDRPIHDFDAKKVLVEVPNAGFADKWEDIVISRMTDVFLDSRGASSIEEAQRMAQELLDRTRRLSRLRLKQT